MGTAFGAKVPDLAATVSRGSACRPLEQPARGTPQETGRIRSCWTPITDPGTTASAALAHQPPQQLDLGTVLRPAWEARASLRREAWTSRSERRVGGTNLRFFKLFIAAATKDGRY